MTARRDPVERFMEKVQFTAYGCWEWTAAQKKPGRGSFGLNGKVLQAHQAAYLLFVGSVPDGLELDHLCRNTLCVNPAHLEPVTHSENVRRGIGWHHAAMKNLAKTHCPRGHAYDEANTYRSPRGDRTCRTCLRMHWKTYRFRKKAADAG